MAKKYTLIATSDTPNFDIASLNLSAGTHTFVVAAKGVGYDTSNYSNEIKCTIHTSGGGGGATHSGGANS